MYDKVIDGLFEMMKRWEPLGQGVFLLLLVIISVSTALALLRYIVIFFRGWPPEGVDVLEGPKKKQ